jgi:hypothetical protein
LSIANAFSHDSSDPQSHAVAVPARVAAGSAGARYETAEEIPARVVQREDEASSENENPVSIREARYAVKIGNEARGDQDPGFIATSQKRV